MDERDFNPSRIGPLLRLAHLASAKTFRTALRPFGIDPRHYGVLVNVETRGPLSQRQLIDLSGDDKSTMVRTIDDLERLGLAERRPDPTDRRANAVHITPKGRRVRAEAEQVGRELADQLMSGFSSTDQQLLIDLLDRFVDSASSYTRGETDSGGAPGRLRA